MEIRSVRASCGYVGNAESLYINVLPGSLILLGSSRLLSIFLKYFTCMISIILDSYRFF